jgi:hypothetical protein
MFVDVHCRSGRIANEWSAYKWSNDIAIGMLREGMDEMR